VMSGESPVEYSLTMVSTQMMWKLVRSSWILHVSCKKRRIAPIAALMSSVMHYSVFGDEKMHEYENAPGPLKWVGSLPPFYVFVLCF